MSSNIEAADAPLIKMLNQIAENFAYQGEQQAAKDTLDHIQRFWAPAMIDKLGKLNVAEQGCLNAVARRVFVGLKTVP